MGAFPNDNALMRLTVSIMIDINEEWITGRKYLSLEVDYGLYRIFSKLQQFMYNVHFFFLISWLIRFIYFTFQHTPHNSAYVFWN
jgi:hypothetical protein